MDIEIYCECGRLLTVIKYEYRSAGIGYFYAKVRPCYVCARLTPAEADTAREAPFCWLCGGHHFDYEQHLRV